MKLALTDGSTLRATFFSNFVLLRFALPSKTALSNIAHSIFEKEFAFVDEVIATEVEICLEINQNFRPGLLKEIEDLDLSIDSIAPSKHQALPIFIDEEHEDWQLIENHTGIGRLEYTKRLLSYELTVAMTGFLPGFVYLNGLPKDLQVPRKDKPSTRTSRNTFAIGGKYAGIYSLPSAAGWNCIGQIGRQIFDERSLPPVSLGPGDSITLEQVDRATFEEMNLAQCGSTSSKLFSQFDESRGTLLIENPGWFSLIQDQGRKGLAWYAIPRSGAMDCSSAKLANTIVGNWEDAPVIECHLIAPRIQFESDATICLTGADMKWHVDDVRVGRNRTLTVSKGSVLDGTTAMKGWRGYIAIQGEIETSRSFGSASTYTPAKFGGNWGEPFARRHLLQWIKPEKQSFPIRVKIERPSQDSTFELERGPEFEMMDEGSAAALSEKEFSITSQSDRMGARLDGPTLSTNGKQLTDSVPLLPGMVQLTPEGQCIIVLQDGQTTGGYPRIGYLNEDSVERLNQTKIGHPFRFRVAE